MNEIITYKDLDWFVINENEREKLLFLKKCFTKEMIMKYFDKHDNIYDVPFNPYNNKQIWWVNSYIRKVLNEKFLNDLDKNDLNLMSTTLSFNVVNSTTLDYVRLLTKEEAEKLSVDILKTDKEYGYFTMTPCDFITDVACVYGVRGKRHPGEFNVNSVRANLGVRPVISLKSLEGKKEENLKDEIRKMAYILNNNKITDAKWIEYYLQYDKLRKFNGSESFVMLIHILEISLIKASLSEINLSKINLFNEYTKNIENNLGISKKLIFK